MNFAFDSVKPKSKVLNEDFYFDFETPGGHCFVVLDFVSHDYVNLNATLKSKLETIVSSFVSLPSFSAELFLGFIAKEINNFIHDLAAQGGGPELLCSAALCFLSGNEFAYFVRGDTQIGLLTAGNLRSLAGKDAERQMPGSAALGKSAIETPTSEVRTTTVAETDAILIMTQSVAATIQPNEKFAAADAQSICEALLKRGAASNADRTLVVISGPYQAQSVLNQEFVDELKRLKEEVQEKAGTTTLLELTTRIDGLTASIAGKANNTELLELKREVVRFEHNEKTKGGNFEGFAAYSEPPEVVGSSSLLKTALVALIVSLAAGFLGGWYFWRRVQPAPEVWSVKSSGNQISITRQNGSTVMLQLARPLTATGEQNFSSFADVQRYIDRISAQDNVNTETTTGVKQPAPTVEVVAEGIVKPGDSLKGFALRYNVSQERILELNPGIKRWADVKPGQKVLIPPPRTAVPSPTPAALIPKRADGHTSAPTISRARP